jgi:hypothetical protein
VAATALESAPSSAAGQAVAEALCCWTYAVVAAAAAVGVDAVDVAGFGTVF